MNADIDQNQILVVEDSDDFRALSTGWLQSAGFKIAEAKNGREALTYLRSHHLPALILLDIQMPVVDAWQFRTEQKSDRRLRDIPIIIFSGEVNIAALAKELDAAGYVAKTENPSRLIEEIRRLLSINGGK